MPRLCDRALCRIFALALVQTLAPACGEDPAAIQETPPTPTLDYPEPTGPYRVGRIALAITDSERDEIYTADPSDHRELMVYVWYPAAPAAGAEPGPFVDAVLADAIATTYGVDREIMEGVRSHAYVDAPADEAASLLPVLLMSHGDGGAPFFYTAFAEELASHGYAVVGMSHTYNAFMTAFPDGRAAAPLPEALVVPPDMAPLETYDDAMALWNRAGDRLRLMADDGESVLRALRDVQASHPILAGHLDLAQLGAFGHSLGGAASVELLRRNDVLAGVDVDGTIFTDAYETGIARPVMIITSPTPEDPVATDEELAEAGLTREQYELLAAQSNSPRLLFESSPTGTYVTVAGTAHLSFCDDCLLAELFPDLGEDVGTIDCRTGIAITNAYLTSFFDRELRGDAAPLLAGEPPYAEVVCETHTPAGAP